MKKGLSWVLVLAMMLSLVACSGAPADATEDGDGTAVSKEEAENKETEAPEGVGGELIIGGGNDVSGDWIPHFQNNASDHDIYTFINEMNTVALTFEGEYVVNDTVVRTYETEVNADGSKTYTWTLNEGLVFSNGEAVTAESYVANLLLWNSKLVADLGGKNTQNYRLVGQEAYAKGAKNVFEGVRLLDTYTFSTTIAPEYLPFFFELPMVNITPEYWPFWLGDGIDVLDDGEGAYFSVTPTVEGHKEAFNAGRNNPKYVSSGAYVVDSFDDVSKTVVLKVNPLYPGDFTGQKPRIETVIFKGVTEDTRLDELKTGSVDLLIKLVSGDEINAGFDLVDQGGYHFTDYPRAGFGKLIFVCDFGPTQFTEVRQAVAYLLDRNAFARTFTDGFGSIVNGPYGEGQWFYSESRKEIDSALNSYAYSPEKAVELLVEGGWVYDANGAPYTEGLRHKKMPDGTYMPLVLEWASTEQNSMSDLLVVQLQENPDVLDAGMKINQTVMTFGELLNYSHRDGSKDKKYAVPTYHMFNLAVNFNPMYDMSKAYSIDEDDIALGHNGNYIYDETLDLLGKKMILNDPADREGFKKDFVAFTTRWNALLPDLPLYSNIYHDFYSDKLKEFNNNSLINTVQAILYAYVSE